MQHLRIGHDAVKSPVTFREMRNKTEVRNIGKSQLEAGSNWPNRGASAVSESGLYSLIFRSKKPQAKDFKAYVTKEILPSIRKTGSFVTGQPSLVENPTMSKTAPPLQQA